MSQRVKRKERHRRQMLRAEEELAFDAAMAEWAEIGFPESATDRKLREGIEIMARIRAELEAL